jgi:uncharacterized protein
MEKLSKDTNALNWFEIPMTNVERAKKFYETIFDIELQSMTMENFEMLMFPSESPKTGGALVKSDFHKPSEHGSIIYLNANPDLQVVLDKIKSAGGAINMPKTQISEDYGYMAFFKDSEGNAVALHSQK